MGMDGSEAKWVRSSGAEPPPSAQAIKQELPQGLRGLVCVCQLLITWSDRGLG